jgi:DNA mismatch endonuclease (patch repair protein)
VDGLRKVKSNTAYWIPKIEMNRARDERHRQALEAEGWVVLTIWECEARDRAALESLTIQVRAVPPHRLQSLSN